MGVVLIIFAQKIFSQRPKKNCCANPTIAFPDSLHPIILVKIPDFGHFISLTE